MHMHMQILAIVGVFGAVGYHMYVHRYTIRNKDLCDVLPTYLLLATYRKTYTPIRRTS
jgi:hypothetical protein